MSQQVAVDLDPDVTLRLQELPSAVTLAEQQLAVYYLSTIWGGEGNVFENGPLLGGATRALALGMMANSNLSAESRLHTYDWFSLGEPLDLPDNVWEILVSGGDLTQERVDEAHRGGSFLPLFKDLHSKEDYWKLIEPHVGYLPGHAGDRAWDGAQTFALPPVGRQGIDSMDFSIAFVDACKSWYGTKYWFTEMLPHLRPGTDLFFQDYGHYTCFWIPMLVETFRDYFELIAYRDYTYIWRLNEVPSASVAWAIYPDEPDGFTPQAYGETFTRLAEEARERGDEWGTMMAQMQCAAAYAYLGDKEKARRILDELLMKAAYLPYRPYMKLARISPTYTPEGRIEL